MTSPVYFTVEADFKAFIEDASSDSDYDPQVVPISATVTFTPLINAGDVVLATNASPRPTGFIPAPITAIIDPADGRLKMRTGTDAGATGFSFAPVRLLGSSALLELDGPLEYSARFSEVVFSNGRRGSIASFNFEAPNTDTVLNLIEVARVPGQPQSGITKIAPGGVRLEDGDIIFSFASVDIPESIPFTPLFTSTEMTDSTVTGRAVITAVDAAAARTAIGAENAAMKGASGGYAPLDGTAKIDAAYLPSYVDDVLSYANEAAFPVTGETGKIYVALDNNDAFRWTGSAYLRISDRVTAAGITDSTSTGRALVTATDAAAAKTTLSLQNVDNTSDANKPISTAAQSALDGKQPLDADLTALAGLTSAADKLPYFTGSGTAAVTTMTAAGRALLDDADAATQRSTVNADYFFTVKDYGATGDGVTDDTTAIQAAIDAASTAALAADSGNRRFVTVHFPKGMYVTANLTVPTCITLQGSAATIKAKSGTTGYLITFSNGFFGGMRKLRVIAANVTDNLGGITTTNNRRGILIEDCSVESFRGRAVYLEGGNPKIKGNLLTGLQGDQTALATYTGVLEFASTANDAMVSDNEINGGRWHPTEEFKTSPTVARDMYICAVAVIGAGFGMFRNNIAEQAETGWYIKDSGQIHMSGNRGEFSWGHGYHFSGGSGRIEGCLSLDNSKVESGAWNGFHFVNGTTNCNYVVTSCVSRSNQGTFGFFEQHQWGVFDNNPNTVFGNSYQNFRSQGDVGWFSAAPAYYGGGPQYQIPSANSAFELTGATPSVVNRSIFRCSGSTTITNFLDSVPGQIFYVLGNGSVAVENNTNLVTVSGANTTLANGKWYPFMSHDGKIYQLDLSPNTLLGKTISFGSNTVTGTTAQFNTALSDNDFATLAGAESLTNKDLSGAGNTFPTLNQNTTGNAATATALQTTRTIDGQSFNGTANITVIAPGTTAATSKTTPVDADEVPLVDSAASNVLKKLTWSNLKATLKTYFDDLSTTLNNKTLASPVLTGTAKVAQTGSVELFNTTDQTTNVEKGSLRWDTNRLEMGTLQSGTGNARNVRVGVGVSAATAATRFLQIGSGAPYFLFWPASGALSGDMVQIATGTSNTLSSGTVNYLAIGPTINQSSTASYTALLINPTETATGSGTKRLIDAQVGGSSKFTVDNTGNTFVAGTIDLGNVSDTTISRVSAGVIAVEGNTVATRLTGTATLDFGSVTAASFADLTITVTGAATGDAVALGTPTAAVTAGIAFTAWVSATDTVTVRAHNYTAGALDPASGTFRATVIR